MFAELGDRHGAALVTFGFAIADALTGQLPRALQGFHTALTTFRELADLPGQANADYSIGRAYEEFRTEDNDLVAELTSVCGLIDLQSRRLLADPGQHWRLMATTPQLLGL